MDFLNQTRLAPGGGEGDGTVGGSVTGRGVVPEHEGEGPGLERAAEVEALGGVALVAAQEM